MAPLPLKVIAPDPAGSPTKHVFFHIGLHKTGTTFLQRFFLEAQAALKQHGSVDFPRAGRVPGQQIIHSNLAWEVLGHNSFDPSLGTCEDALCQIRNGSSQRWIISTEGLSRLKNPAQLLARFEEFRRTVIVYTREPCEYLPSRYTETLKAGSRMTFSSWLNKKGVEMCDYIGLVRRWQEASDVLIWKKFDRSRLKSGDLVADFFESVGVDFTSRRSLDKQVNSRSSHFEMLCLFLWNVVNTVSNESVDVQLNHRRKVRAISRELGASTRLGQPFDIINQGEQQALYTVLSDLGDAGTRTPPPPIQKNWEPELDLAQNIVQKYFLEVTGVPMPQRLCNKMKRRAGQFVGNP